jgi:hypothetical protein
MTLVRNADDGHMNVARNASRSSFVIASDIVAPLAQGCSKQ